MNRQIIPKHKNVMYKLVKYLLNPQLNPKFKNNFKKWFKFLLKNYTNYIKNITTKTKKNIENVENIENLPKGSWINSAINYKIINSILYTDLYEENRNQNSTCVAIYDNVEYHNINGNFTVGNIDNTLFVCIGNQLGNCLRVISSCVVLAKYYNKKIFIDYDYSGLVGKEKIIIKKLFPHLCLINVSHLYEKINYEKCVKYNSYPGTNYHLIDEGRLLELPSVNNFAITNTIYSVLPGNMNYSEYNYLKHEFYNSINFPLFLMNEVNSFLQIYNLSNFIGFHIRYTDNLNDTCKKSYNTNKETFFQRIEYYKNESILLCSDNKDIINECKNMYPSIITVNSCSESIYQGLYEMILLSKTKLIVGSNSSSFSYESAYFSGTNIELFENNSWNLYSLSG